MQFKITGRPEFSMINVTLSDAESIVAESGAMVSMSSNMQIKTSSRGGVLKGLTRSFLGGESFFMNTYTAQGGDADIKLAPSVPGDLMHRTLNGEDFYLQSGAYVAGSPTIAIDTKFQGLKGFFSGEGLFMLKASGKGDLFFCSFGAIEEVDVSAFDGEYVVDTGYIVAFESTLKYNIRTVGGLKSTFFSGEGLVCKFTGSGKLWLQTRAGEPLASWVHPFRSVRSRSNN